MDLKDFIKETISSIADATSELQEEYIEKDIIINPPSMYDRETEFEAGDFRYTLRRVVNVAFDVAVTAEKETAGKAKAGLKVMSMEIGGGGEHKRTHESVSRVQFSVPMTLSPDTSEAEHRRLSEARDRKFKEATAKKRSRGAGVV